MPTAPKKVKRSWIQERKPHQRLIDNSAFYNSWTWRKFSKRYKQKNPVCVECKKKGVVTAATVTDHIIRFEDGGPGFDLSNLKDKDFQSLCDFHHNSKSGKEAHGFKQK